MVGDLVIFNFGVVVNCGAHDCSGGRTVVAINFVEVIGVQGILSDTSLSLLW